MIAPVQNKIGAVLSDPTLHRILVSPQEPIRFRRLLDEGGFLVVNLAKGQLGEDSAATLGSLLVSTLGLAALSRSDTPESERRPFHILVDEFQTFTTLAFATQMAELRKVKASLTLATQHLGQVPQEVRGSVLANAGTLLSFRLGAEDAAVVAKELQPTFQVVDLLNLPNRHFYVRLMIDGAPSRPFSGRTMSLDSASPDHR
jgi:DNA helicase HerA-like ATPase